MAKNRKRQRRQRALNARHQASNKPRESIIANEFQHLIGADRSDVEGMARWTAKSNFWGVVIGFPVILSAFLYATFQFHGHPGAGRFFIFFWPIVAIISFFLIKGMVKYKKLIDNS